MQFGTTEGLYAYFGNIPLDIHVIGHPLCTLPKDIHAIGHPSCTLPKGELCLAISLGPWLAAMYTGVSRGKAILFNVVFKNNQCEQPKVISWFKRGSGETVVRRAVRFGIGVYRLLTPRGSEP
jgi:hypothetical protein